MEQYNPNHYDHVFNKWAHVYDQTVSSSDGEYQEVFAGYEKILAKVVDLIDLPAGSYVLDLGTGTGNLAAQAARQGYNVTGVDPNQAMISIARQKYPALTLQKGDFFNLPHIDRKYDAIISSYAFHHLTDEEKSKAALLFRDRLSEYGKIIFADTVFITERVRQIITNDAKSRGFCQLVQDLRSEYYTTHEKMRAIFEGAGFYVTFTPMNKFVWIMLAKPNLA